MDLLSQYSDEEIAEREALIERDLLADKGFYSEPGVCGLCLGTSEHVGELCDPCKSYDRWVRERLGSWWG